MIFGTGELMRGKGASGGRSENAAAIESLVSSTFGAGGGAASPEHEEGAQEFAPRAPSRGLGDLWRRVTLRRLWRRD